MGQRRWREIWYGKKGPLRKTVKLIALCYSGKEYNNKGRPVASQLYPSIQYTYERLEACFIRFCRIYIERVKTIWGLVNDLWDSDHPLWTKVTCLPTRFSYLLSEWKHRDSYHLITHGRVLLSTNWYSSWSHFQFENKSRVQKERYHWRNIFLQVES